MPFPLLIIMAIFGVLARIMRAAVEEDERRQSRAAQERYYRRQEELRVDRYPDRIQQSPTPAPIPAPQPPREIPVPDEAHRRSRRFLLRIPLADNQVAIALRPIRAAAMAEHPHISGVTFTAEPGGSVVELIITLDEGSTLEEGALEKIFRDADQALQEGYRAR